MNEDGGNVTVQNPNPVGAEVARGGEKENKKKKGKLPVIILAVLGVVIVGLIVAIIVVAINGNKSNGEGDDNPGSSVVDDETQKKHDILQGIQDEMQTIEDSELDDYIDDKVYEYNEDTNMVYSILQMQAYRKYSGDDFAGALEVMQKVDPKELTIANQIDYYDRMETIYNGLGDAEKAEESKKSREEAWEKFYDEYGGAGGGI